MLTHVTYKSQPNNVHLGLNDSKTFKLEFHKKHLCQMSNDNSQTMSTKQAQAALELETNKFTKRLKLYLFANTEIRICTINSNGMSKWFCSIMLIINGMSKCRTTK